MVPSFWCLCFVMVMITSLSAQNRTDFNILVGLTEDLYQAVLQEKAIEQQRHYALLSSEYLKTVSFAEAESRSELKLLPPVQMVEPYQDTGTQSIRESQKLFLLQEAALTTDHIIKLIDSAGSKEELIKNINKLKGYSNQLLSYRAL